MSHKDVYAFNQWPLVKFLIYFTRRCFIPAFNFSVLCRMKLETRDHINSSWSSTDAWEVFIFWKIFWSSSRGTANNENETQNGQTIPETVLSSHVQQFASSAVEKYFPRIFPGRKHRITICKSPDTWSVSFCSFPSVRRPVQETKGFIFDTV